MKTALQELIEYIEEWQPKNKFTEPIWHKAKSLLEKEKQQIIEAYIAGYSNWDSELEEEKYYNDTFEQ
jgi:hypothetical protein